MMVVASRYDNNFELKYFRHFTFYIYFIENLGRKMQEYEDEQRANEPPPN